MKPGILVAEAVVVLPPDVRREEVVERRDRPAPRDPRRRLQPLRMLVEHRVDDVDEGLVAVEEAVPAGQQVPLEPALALVLGEHLDARGPRAQCLVGREDLRLPGARGHLEDRAQPVRRRLVGAEDAEAVGVAAHDVPQEGSEDAGRLGGGPAGRLDGDGVVAEVGQRKRLEQQAAVRARVRAHSPVALRWQRRQGRDQGAAGVEELLGPVALQPVLELLEVGEVRSGLGERHLVRAPRALRRLPVDLLGARPPLRRAHHDHRPARAFGPALLARGSLDGGDLLDDRVEHLRHPLVHRLGLVAVDPVHGVAIALEQRVELVVADPGEDGRVRDLVAVQVEDRQDCAVRGGVEELVRVPARRERPRLGLAVADDTADEQVGVVERRPVGVREGVAELAAFVDRPRRLGRHM